MMRKIYFICALFFAVTLVLSCKKTPDYTAVPFKCNCGTISWQGVPYDLLGVNYILSDSTESESRRYYLTAKVSLPGELQTHGLSAWIEIPNLDGGGQFNIDAQSGQSEFTAWVDEYNLNDPIDTLRQYVPVNAVVQVSEAPITGGTESVNFLFTLNQLSSTGTLIPGNVNSSGSFTVYINQ